MLIYLNLKIFQLIQPMAMEQVLSDRDSEDEVDDDVADLEDRRVCCLFLMLLLSISCVSKCMICFQLFNLLSLEVMLYVDGQNTEEYSRIMFLKQKWPSSFLIEIVYSSS